MMVHADIPLLSEESHDFKVRARCHPRALSCTNSCELVTSGYMTPVSASSNLRALPSPLLLANCRVQFPPVSAARRQLRTSGVIILVLSESATSAPPSSSSSSSSSSTTKKKIPYLASPYLSLSSPLLALTPPFLLALYSKLNLPACSHALHPTACDVAFPEVLSQAETPACGSWSVKTKHSEAPSNTHVSGWNPTSVNVRTSWKIDGRVRLIGGGER